jgi:hypothetical protein
VYLKPTHIVFGLLTKMKRKLGEAQKLLPLLRPNEEREGHKGEEE